MGRQFKHFLEVEPETKNTSQSPNSGSPAPRHIYSCRHCQSHFALSTQLISKSFHGKTGSAYLFQNCVNIFKGPESEKDMMTGKHVVCDLYCNTCTVIIGWTYVSALAFNTHYLRRLRHTRKIRNIRRANLLLRKPTCARLLTLRPVAAKKSTQKRQGR